MIWLQKIKFFWSETLMGRACLFPMICLELPTTNNQLQDHAPAAPPHFT